jgi:hypothetical protein
MITSVSHTTILYDAEWAASSLGHFTHGETVTTLSIPQCQTRWRRNLSFAGNQAPAIQPAAHCYIDLGILAPTTVRESNMGKSVPRTCDFV